MNIDDVNNIAVIGAGNMGHQISLLCAIQGYRTTCTDIKDDILRKAEAFADSYLPGRVEKGRMTEEQAQAARDRITFTASMEAAVKDADFVIEAVLEVLDLKRKIFADLDKMAPAHAILATNSSAIISSK
ncbi:MAG: 3-hydroxyacyl-CoA dehydrogenase family protein, partial [Desulfobacterales bacterium]